MTAQAGGASYSASASLRSPRDTARNDVRRQLRQQRRVLTPAIKQQAAQQIARQLARAWILRPGKRIGIYLATAEELDLQPTIELAWRRRCQLFVPHIINMRRRQMRFYPFTPQSRLQIHSWGMQQLARSTRHAPIATATLDVILVPTVAFDAAGHRLGMGGGFYDRHFARLRLAQRWRKPQLIGIAYALQQVRVIAPHTHDVTLDAVVTERDFIATRR